VNGLTAIGIALVKSLNFLLEMHIPGSSSVHTDKKSKGPRSTHCWAVISRTKCPGNTQI
jgi:hypothetical protein